jgi:hypothetical protein
MLENVAMRRFSQIWRQTGTRGRTDTRDSQRAPGGAASPGEEPAPALQPPASAGHPIDTPPTEPHGLAAAWLAAVAITRPISATASQGGDVPEFSQISQPAIVPGPTLELALEHSA